MPSTVLLHQTNETEVFLTKCFRYLTMRIEIGIACMRHSYVEVCFSIALVCWWEYIADDRIMQSQWLRLMVTLQKHACRT
mmetsp:Transcript_1004/g.1508  ORF Transcript_1004/g.1508 Transcript_1004/m.1508 type:complete len:80 (+) Transcript_1004:183-422(+)